MTCKLCGGNLGYLGTLGDLDHYQCRHCGMESSEPASNDHDQEEDEPSTIEVRPIHDIAERVAEIVFAPDYYDGPWEVHYRGHTRVCSNYSTAKAWATYLTRQEGGWSHAGISIGKVLR